MEHLKQLAQKLGITVEELKARIEKNQNAERDAIESNAKKTTKNK